MMYSSGPARPHFLCVAGLGRRVDEDVEVPKLWVDEVGLVSVMERAHRPGLTRLVHGHPAMWCALPIFQDRWRYQSVEKEAEVK
jgi:hypothetical protein